MKLIIQSEDLKIEKTITNKELQEILPLILPVGKTEKPEVKKEEIEELPVTTEVQKRYTREDIVNAIKNMNGEFCVNDVIKVLTKKNPEKLKKEDKLMFERLASRIRLVLREMTKRNEVVITRKEQVAFRYTKTGEPVFSRTKKHFFIKTSGNFPYTNIPFKRGLEIIKQAIHDKKLTYIKDAGAFGFDRRKANDTKWLKLLTFIAWFVRNNKLCRDVKLDVETKSLTFF